MAQRDDTSLCQFLDEIAERADPIVFLREGGIELQQRALEQAELRRHFAFGKHLEGTLHERNSLADISYSACAVLFPRPGHGVAAPHEVFVGDEFVTVLLHHLARELPPPDDKHFFVVLLQLFDERDEIAIATDDDKRVDVIVRERHLERIERKIDVGAVLVAAGRKIPLHHPDGMLRHQPPVVACPLPVTIRHFRDNLAAFFDALQNRCDVELCMQSCLDTNLDVVEIDEYGNLQSLIDQCVLPESHVTSLKHTSLPLCPAKRLS